MTLALVVGCADSVWDEVEKALSLAKFDHYYVVKMAGIHWDKSDYFSWITLHPEFMDNYKAKRKELGLHDNFEIVAPLESEVGNHWKHHADRRVTYRWHGMSSSASSGIYAAKVALDDGHSHVIMAGVPMEVGGNHFSRGRPWLQVDCFLDGWRQSIPKLKGKVVSFSGRTKDELGEPTPEWLAQAREAQGTAAVTATHVGEKDMQNA